MKKTPLILEILKIGNDAVRKAQINNLKKGIPNVFAKDGKIFFQLPDGTITQEIPDVYKNHLKELK